MGPLVILLQYWTEIPVKRHAYSAALHSSTVTHKVPTTYRYNLHTLYIPLAAQLLPFNWVTFYLKMLVVLQTLQCVFSEENKI